MGQRLNLEIVQGEDVIANSYYHWSGYTDSALELIKRMIHELKLSKEQNSYATSPDAALLRVVSAFHKTDAKLSEDNLPYIEKSDLDTSTKLILTRCMASYTSAVDRSDGLIAISPEDIASTQHSAEFTAIIDYDSLTVDFGVISHYEDLEELQDSYEMDEEDAESIPLYDKDLETASMTIDHIGELEEALKLSHKHDYGCFKTPNGSYYSSVG